MLRYVTQIQLLFARNDIFSLLTEVLQANYIKIADHITAPPRDWICLSDNLETLLKKSKCLRPKEYEPTKDKIWSCPFQSQVNLKIVCKENFKYEVQERSPANQVHILVPSLQNPGIGVDCYIFLTKKHVHILNWHCSHKIYSTSETSNGFLWRI